MFTHLLYAVAIFLIAYVCVVLFALGFIHIPLKVRTKKNYVLHSCLNDTDRYFQDLDIAKHSGIVQHPAYWESFNDEDTYIEFTCYGRLGYTITKLEDNDG